MKRNMVIAALSMGVLVGFCAFAGSNGADSHAKRELLRVGVYDSRAIAIAYAHSRHNDNMMEAKSQAKHEAEAAGDTAAAEKIDREMGQLQTRRHLQAFGTAPVHELLASIEKKIPPIAEEMGVDVIVSKWEFDYRAEDGDVVDVTMQLVRAFETTERAMKYIRQLDEVKPVSEAELLQHELEGGH